VILLLGIVWDIGQRQETHIPCLAFFALLFFCCSSNVMFLLVLARTRTTGIGNESSFMCEIESKRERERERERERARQRERERERERPESDQRECIVALTNNGDSPLTSLCHVGLFTNGCALHTHVAACIYSATPVAFQSKTTGQSFPSEIILINPATQIEMGSATKRTHHSTPSVTISGLLIR